MENLSSLPRTSNILDEDLFLLERDSEQKKITGEDMKSELGTNIEVSRSDNITRLTIHDGTGTHEVPIPDGQNGKDAALPDNLILYTEDDGEELDLVSDVVAGEIMGMEFDVVDGNLLRLKYGQTVVASVALQAVGAVVKPCTNLELSQYTVSQSILDPTPIVLHPVITPSDCTQPVKWYSTKKKVAQVEDGVITIKSEGNCFIQAICGNLSQKCLVVAKMPVFRFVVGTLNPDTGVEEVQDNGMRVRSNMLYIPAGTKFTINTGKFRYLVYYYNANGSYLRWTDTWQTAASIAMTESYQIRFVIREINYKVFPNDDSLLELVQSAVTIIPPKEA